MKFRILTALTTILLLALLAGCSGGEEAAEETAAPATPKTEFTVDSATAATITGKVTFTGKAPRRPRLLMDAEAACASAHSGRVLAENFVPNDNGTLRHVFVYIKSDFGGATFPIPEEPAVLNQKGCLYMPHVLGVMAGQQIRIMNSDTVTHNVHPIPKNNRESNHSQAPGTAPIEKVFAREEIGIQVKCNVHPWMKAYVNVLKHPYFSVTGEDGTFTIPNLPPGDYTLVAWQESLGEQEMQVTVGDSETKEVDIVYSGS